MPVQAIAAAPDEPPSSVYIAGVADMDEIAVERVFREELHVLLYGDEFPDRYREPVPPLTEAERHEATRRLNAVRDRRNRSYRFVCSKAAAARRAGGAR